MSPDWLFHNDIKEISYLNSDCKCVCDLEARCNKIESKKKGTLLMKFYFV